jgi:hypothetical protein
MFEKVGKIIVVAAIIFVAAMIFLTLAQSEYPEVTNQNTLAPHPPWLAILPGQLVFFHRSQR